LLAKSTIYQYLTTPAKAMQMYQLMRAGSHFLIAICMAKIGLATSQIGEYEWMVWFGMVLSTFWINALLQSMPFAYAHLEDAQKQGFIRQTFVLFSLLGLVVLGLFALTKSAVIPWVTGLIDLPGIWLFLIYLSFHIGTYPVEIWYLIEQKGAAIFWWGFATFIIHVFALILPIYLTNDVTNGLLAIAVLSGLRWLFAGYLAFGTGKIGQFQWALIKPWLKVSGPLIVYALIGHLITSFDAWLVGNHYQDSAVFALFRYGSREFPVSLAMATALGISLLPHLSSAWQTKQLDGAMSLMKAKTTKLLHIVFPLAISVVLSADWLFLHLFNAAFGAAASLFCIYMLTTIPRVLIPTSLLIAKGDTRVLSQIAVLELALKIVLGVVLLNAFGLPGLAWSAVICALFEKLAVTLYLSIKYSVSITDWIDLKWLLIYSVLLIGSVVFSA
jgi:O-antigen/teichoic acid export membrane protein